MAWSLIPKNPARHARGPMLGLLLGSLALAGAHADEASARQAMLAAQACSDSGDVAASLPKWKEALAIYTQDKNGNGQLEASIRLADADQALGQDRLADEVLENAKALNKTVGNRRAQALIQTSLGALFTLAIDTDDAEGCLKDGLKLAEELGDSHLIAVAENNLANFDAYRKDYDGAAAAYTKAFAAAEASDDPALTVKVAANSATTYLNQADWAQAEKWAGTVVDHAHRLPDTHAKAIDLTSAGAVFQQVFVQSASADDDLRRQAFGAYLQAADVATRIKDTSALSDAVGYEAQLYEMEKSFSDALALTRRAIFLAQQARDSDMLFRWEAQAGRLLGEMGEREAAITADQEAIVTLHAIRHDLSLHYGNVDYHSSFRDVAGTVFFALADLLLQRADDEKDDKAVQADLVSARDVMEDLKSAELEDYFQDDCANLLKSKITRVESISPTAVVIYIIPLVNRTELLVTLPSGEIKRIKSEVTADQLEETATQFRFNLEKRTTNEYLDQACQLYDWLIRPLQGVLDEARPDTLVFVPDGALLTFPMSALNDGDHFLVEKYAIATIPGMTLLEPKPLKEAQGGLISNGLSDAVQGFAPLEHVEEEMQRLKALYGGPEYLNKAFVKSAVDKEFAGDDYSIVHIASHGHFDSDASKSFVLTYDGKLSLDELERMILPSQIRDKPVELLTLSACQTAAGDDRAALGLAGIAVKSGARSAFATLWFVDDEASSMIVEGFYGNLHDHPGTSKAKALQEAQEKLLADPRYGHPCYWAPYLIIGNWL